MEAGDFCRLSHLMRIPPPRLSVVRETPRRREAAAEWFFFAAQ